MDRSKIETYAEGGAELAKAYSWLSHAQLHAKPVDGSRTESSKTTLERMLDKYIERLRHHLIFITKKRRLLETASSSASLPTSDAV